MLHITQTTSTIDELKRLARLVDLPEGFCLWADYQTAGRGQQDNVWESAPDMNLLAAMLLRPVHIPVREQFLLSQIVSLGMKQVLDRYIDGVSVKWPNDIYCHDRKLAGILIETSLQGNRFKNAVIGIGLNVNQRTFAGDFNAVSLAMLRDEACDRQTLLSELSDAILRIYREWTPDQVRTAYLHTLYRRTGYHPYADARGEFEARITTVEPDGRLLLKDRQGRIRGYYMKEVTALVGRP